ncbi:Peptidase M20 domain-containing protein 2 [Trichoplax sp. H2]|nr:Peptidase M20 domain-containing protein 2 [Trichoplax sp. H2]|eukprot:RDD41801.1 Peptidase M20 domain-containing protein 2 [Trichoplax sp. H2]
MSIEELKKIAIQAIDDKDRQLFDVNQQIHKNPELSFEEFKAHDVLTNFLEKEGFQVDRGYFMPTAFRAVFSRGKKGPKMCVLCEYDALPEIGHACGHNLIAEAGIAAAIGIKAAMESSQNDLGHIVVYGTPAEEGGGGKIKMIKEGCFDDIDVAMMVHPCPFDAGFVSILSLMEMTVTYEGKNAHASGYPWEGVNALDAAVQAYVNISTLRQQFKPSWRVHGVISNGGVKSNIIPSKSQLIYYIRAPSATELKLLKGKCENCFHSAAQATGCKVKIEYDVENIEDCYAALKNNVHLVHLYKKNATSLGIKFLPLDEEANLPSGSTDMGNVSWEVPSIHPLYKIDTEAANHTPEFTNATCTEQAHQQTLIAAKSMAMTTLDALTNADILRQIKEEFSKSVNH